ncbi:hypothetical protein M2360_003815 [Rhizobium sp. SG_E_25_P2]|uniref:hypothetical protein n=1 Tax=Rhizobium sp. SG_E_25_P2 TaxID=2879942 RepID=UPI002473FA12|nr:hypothetical protein [Rhizobium sp. SG_E_25_P2]MDH6268410.1 hypothetical protein [Rhizobium sp. SG_E_25_P2]
MRPELGKIWFKMYGLAHERNGQVRADVFAKKLALLAKGLRAADQYVNGGKSVNYLISDLQYGSAVAHIVEVECNINRRAQESSIREWHSVVRNVNQGWGISRELPRSLVKTIADLGNGSGKTFSHAELGASDDAQNVIRIDQFFDKKADRALEDLNRNSASAGIFRGTALGTFDGTLKEVDLRGTVASAKLILNLGDKEIDCTCNSVTVQNLKEALDNRVTVSALAYYNGNDRLPEQIEIKKIKLLGSGSGLRRWRGQFNLNYAGAEDVW